MYSHLPLGLEHDRPSYALQPSLPLKVHNKKGQLRKFVHKATLQEAHNEVLALKFDPTDKYLACGYGDGAVRIFNTSSGKCAFTLSSHVDKFGGSGDGMPVTGVLWRPHSNEMKTANVLVSSHANGIIKHWHATSGRCLHQITCAEEEENHFYTMDYNPSGTVLAAAGKDRYIRLYDEQTKSLLLKMKESATLCGHSNRIYCVKFNPMDPNMIASGGWDNTIQIYDIRRKGPVKSIYGPHVCGETIDFRNDGTTLLTGSYRQEDPLELFDLRKFQKFRDIAWNGPSSQDQEPIENQLVEEHVHEEDDFRNLEQEEEEKSEEAST
mmetsp:Transcript_2690/g.4538  ORF Transcript_2690/g.4538 Transcript_2690/m.4538 type:complete len:324 (+) Transcript_2690:20-991(+)